MTKDWKNRNWMLKTLSGMLINLCGAYLVFFPQTYAILFLKISGVIALLFSYYIFYADIDRRGNIK